MNKVTISTLPVTIKVIQVAGKRMTLSVFHQIPNRIFLDDEIAWLYDDILAEEYLGWVKYNGISYILFQRYGILWKHAFINEVPNARDRFAILEINRKYENYVLPENQLYISL